MGIEDNIRDLLSKGHTPQEVIKQGYRKSTVYKVYSEFTTEVVPVTEPMWHINWRLPKERYLPGETVAIRYSIRNSSGLDLYVYQSGLQPEWMDDGEWYIREDSFLLQPGNNRNLALNIPIPTDIPLGEYEMRWGLGAQFVGPGTTTYNVMQTQWTEPFVLEVKRPTTDYKVFISHSTTDMHLVRQLECSLDNEGIKGIIAGDYREPGRVLREKFKTMIRESQFFLALLTSAGLDSDWVLFETDYAVSITKPSILLKEKEASATSGIEWVEFSLYDPPETIIAKALEALDLVKQRHYRTALPPNLAPVAIGVLAFLFGLAAGKSRG